MEKILQEFGVRVQKSTVSYWTRGLHSPLGRAHDFSPIPVPELAYIIGVEKGDGSLTVLRSSYTYRIRLQSVDIEFVQEFNRCLSKVLDSDRHALWRGAGRREIHVAASSFLLHHFLQKPFEELRQFVEHCTECSAAFLRGFFDSEGCVDKSESITASNCDTTLLRYVQSLLTRAFGIETTGPNRQSRMGSLIERRGKIYKRNSDCFVIRIRNKSRMQFLVKVGLTISRKRRRLDNIRQAVESGDVTRLNGC
jgi:intein-encoded DNA endonuclease-like protein